MMSNTNIWRYLPPEITAIVIEGKSVVAAVSTDVVSVTDPKKALVLRRPDQHTKVNHNSACITTQWNDLQVEGYIVEPGWEGDPSLPGGVHRLSPYVEEIFITTTDGTDMLPYLKDSAIDEAQAYLLQYYHEL